MSQFSKRIFFLSQQFCLALTLLLLQPLHGILGIPSLPSQLGSLPSSISRDGLELPGRLDEPRGSHMAAEHTGTIWPVSPK